jgi:hypothetical protein
MTASSSMAEDGSLDLQRLPAPIRFPDGAGLLSGSSSMESGYRESDPGLGVGNTLYP